LPGLWAAANGIAGAIWYYIAPQLSTTYATNGAKSVLTIQAFVVFGLFFGLAQWLVLRRYRRVGLAWLLIAPFAGLAALIVGFSIGFVFFFAGPALFSGPGAWFVALLILAGCGAGALVGSVQATFLRNWLEEPLWLVVGSAVGGGAAALLLGTPFAGVIYGLATGPILEWQRR